MEACHEYRQLKVFHKDSSLFRFLKDNSELVSGDSRCYRLSTIHLAIEQIIRRKNLFDPRNPEVVVCNQELEEVFDVKSFTRGELKTLIEKHFLSSDSIHLSSSRLCNEELKSIIECRHFPSVSRVTPSIANFDIEGTYLVNPAFMQALKETGKVATGLTVLPYRFVCNLLADYIMMKKCELIDLRNIRVINAKGDQLSKAFNMDYFSRSQVTSLIRSQLRPVRRSKRLQK